MPEGLCTLAAEAGDFREDVAAEALAGLTAPQKTLPAKFFYDEEGCRLFGLITGLPEYYPTRTELALLRDVAQDVGRLLPPGTVVVEYGAGDETKAALLLAALNRPHAYVPIDIAEPALLAAAKRLRDRFPALDVHPLALDFLAPFDLPPPAIGRENLGFFPGSTIGNLDPAAAVEFLAQARKTLGRHARFLVGVDRRKDPAVLLPAYDDAAGVTAAFNLNLLARLNREAGGGFDLSGFAHRALWNDAESRIEMHLVSLRTQTAMLAGQRIAFASGETIHTENSYKHTPEGFRALALLAGWRPAQLWTDKDGLFSLHLLAAKD